MKARFLITVFALLGYGAGFSQDVYDQMAMEVCDCVSKKDLTGKNQEERNMELGFCIMESLGKHESEVQVDISDQSAMQALGEKIGLKMATKCPSTLQKAAAMEETTEVAVEQVMTVEGTVKRVEGDDFSYLIIEDENGRSQKYLWLRYFNGSELLAGNHEALNGKKVRLTYGLIECYSPKAGDYFNQKEIRGLEVL